MASSQPGSPKISPSSFDEFNSNLQNAALKSTRHALSLPADLAFHRSMDPELSRDLDAFSTRVLSVANSLLKLVSTAETGAHSARGRGVPKLENQDDVVDSFQSIVVDAMDQLLERADMSLDTHLGRIKPPAIAVNPVEAPKKKHNVPRGRLDPVLQHAAHIPKPQLKFTKKPVNVDGGSPWRPHLPHKYNARVPLGYNYADPDGGQPITTAHPYQHEIRNIAYPTRMFVAAPPMSPRSFDETPFSWVAAPADFAGMLEKLRGAKEIAVDLEHHGYRSWSGFLCLMQISTREEDFVVDTLVLREELQELNEVFTNPDVVKVFHGAESDIVWLQQDFSLYIVNLFDTYHASKALEFSRHGLANLLEAYCDFTPDKRYQLADWRIRPLPKEMLDYARSDTHFLLYIYDNLRNALLDRALTSPPSPSSAASNPLPAAANCDPAHALVRGVLERSADTSLRVYEGEVYDPEGGGPGGWDAMARKWNKGSLMRDAGDSAQRSVYRAVHAWRDRVARAEDESRQYVLVNNYLFQLAERPPADVAALLATFKSVPPVVRRRAKELLDTIREAAREHRDVAAATPDVLDVVMAPAETARPPLEAPRSTGTDTLASRLWSQDPQIGKAVATPSASLSTLFGSMLVVHRDGKVQTSACAAPTSALFRTKASVLLTQDTTSFQDVLSRIHRSLVIAPSAPKLNLEDTVVGEDAAADPDADLQPAIAGQVEIPFVPAIQRQPVSAIDDSIVVVGQARKKKRKRTKAESVAGADMDVEVPENADTPHNDGDSAEPFDYSTVPNILDDVPTPDNDAASRKKKQRHNKGGVLEYGNFPAPPKAHREFKGGNQSYSFK